MSEFSAYRQVAIGKEATLGDTGAALTRLIPVEVTVSPTNDITPVTDRWDGSRAEDLERVQTGRSTALTMSGQLYYELVPLLVSKTLGAGTNLDESFLDAVTDGSATTGTAANPTNPRSVTRTISSVETSVDPTVSTHIVGVSDGTNVKYVRGVYCTDFTITIEEGAPVTFTANLVGMYPEDASLGTTLPTTKLTDLSPIDSQNWNVNIAGITVDLTVVSATVTVPSGMSHRGYIDGGLDYNKLIPGRRKGSMELRVANTTKGQNALDLVNTLEETQVILLSTGAALRTSAPLLNRALQVSMYGQFVAQGDLYEDLDGALVQSMTLETLADSNDKDIDFEITARSDSATGGIV